MLLFKHSRLLPALLAAALLVGCRGNDGPSPPASPGDEQKSFRLAPGLDIQLVAAEPLVEDPVVITFDDHGRLWVVEMRGFMEDVDGSNEQARSGRISVLFDINGDGTMDSGKVYIDSLIMPRAMAVVKGGILLCEDQKLWFAPDSDGDLRADDKILIDPDYAGPALPEHSGNGLWRGIDNWYYNAKSRFRYRYDHSQWVRDSTEFRGQWGLSHDDQGRLYYNYNWSQLHADLVPPNYLSRNKNHQPTSGIDHGLTLDRRIYPIRPTPAVNRGYIPGTLDKEGKLLEFTAACSPLFYRAQTLPAEYYGNVFVCEPSGNLIKRNVVKEDGVLLSAYDPTPGKEFLASTDERFRPVHTASGPDGALYVADMYRGVIQHAAYVTPYLREQSIQRKLEQPIHYGRIWRIVPKGWQALAPKTPAEATPSERVGMLAHPNGWYRDVAQRLLVESGDKSVGDDLRLMMTGSYSESPPQTRRHAVLHTMWTMDGLGINDADLLKTLVADSDVVISNHALRILEKMDAKGIAAEVYAALKNSGYSKDPGRALQVCLSSPMFPPAQADELMVAAVSAFSDVPVIRDAVMSSLEGREYSFLTKLMQSPAWAEHTASKEIFIETLAVAIANKAAPAEMDALFAMLNSTQLTWWQEAILAGIALPGERTIALKTAPALLRTANISEQRRKSIERKFSWPGHVADTASSGVAQLDDRQQQLFAIGRQHYLNTCSGCHGNKGEGMSRFAPTLAGSEWVVGDERRLALLLLHGIEGPIEIAGKMYDAPDILPVMPAHSTLDDQVLTSIMVYIRNEWGNEAGPVTPRVVGRIRHRTQGRVMPWTAKELNDHMLHIDELEEE